MIAPTPLWRSLDIQRRVIGALLMREIITRYGRHNIGFLWLFMEPMIFTLGVTALWNLLRSGHGFNNLSITAFAITGYSSIMLWRNTVNKCLVAITPNLSLMYHRHVKVIDVFASRIILEITGASIAFIFLLLVFAFIGWMEPPNDILKMLAGWLMLSWFSAALALTLGALTEWSELTMKVWHPVSYLMFPLSGAAFMLDWLSPPIREMAYWVPMVHGVELLREGYFGNLVHARYDLVYMAAVCLCLTFYGLAMARNLGRNLEPQ